VKRPCLAHPDAVPERNRPQENGRAGPRRAMAMVWGAGSSAREGMLSLGPDAGT